MEEISLAISFMISVLTLKIVAFVIGYKIVKLGHDTLIKGISGDLDFGFGGTGVNAKLKSASPGTFFVLMGSAIILWGLTVQKPFNMSTNRKDVPSTLNDSIPNDKIPLPIFEDD